MQNRFAFEAEIQGHESMSHIIYFQIAELTTTIISEIFLSINSLKFLIK